MELPSLRDLDDPSRYSEPLALGEADRKTLLAQLRMMLIIRFAEEQIGDKVAEGLLKCPCHLGIGQEAIAVGVSAHLRKTDRVFGGHRSHSHYLAQGGSLHGLFAEVLGRETGCSKGMGGSMHLYDGPNGFLGSVPIVAATVPLAVGAGLAAKKDKRGDVSVAYFGDGASEEGCIHESLNFAAAFGVPIVFVCENNFFSSHMHIKLRQPSSSIARFAAAHHVPYEVIDGNDVVAVSQTADRMVRRARQNEGPGFIEAVTYRWRGHVGPSEDIDVGVKRGTDLPQWKRRDPVRRLFEALEQESVLTKEQFDQLQREVRDEIDLEWHRAEEAPYPPLQNTLSMVYAEGRETRRDSRTDLGDLRGISVPSEEKMWEIDVRR
jgi:TPP-dependent pyruvate/acetoin dehydrogenase alpha subunit